jgi:outer membrane lipoprotein-sorting protein
MKSMSNFHAELIPEDRSASPVYGTDACPISPMKQFSLLLLITFASLSGLCSAATDGSALAQKIYDRPDGVDASTRAEMILSQKGSKPRQRTLFTYRLDDKNGETRSLMRFTVPADIDGTGLLTHDLPGDESNQWIYLPALDRARRISSSRKGGRFVGSDIYYEDLRKRDVEKDRHRILGNGKVGKIATTMLESIPLDADNSVYSKRISWVHMKTLIPLQVDYYTAGSKTPAKRLKVKKIKKLQGYWTVLDNTVYDIASGHQTRIVTRNVKYDQQLPISLFSRQALSDTKAEHIYRP